MNPLVRCRHCHCLFLPNPRAKEQRYCSRRVCQRGRKAAWQQHKLKVDAAYQDNQKRCQRDWRRRNPTYWRRYRSEHPDYVETNRLRQKLRDRKRRPDLAKMDPSEPTYPLKPGNYYLVAQRAELAKMDAFAQKVFLIPTGYADLAKKDSMDDRFAPR